MFVFADRCRIFARRAESLLERRGGFAMPLLVGALVVLSLIGSAQTLPTRWGDLRAFYCSGRAVLTGRDPYREHPLHECEQSLAAPFLAPISAEITIPAPYPGYALSVFALVALLPFGAAVLAWTGVATIATVVAIVVIARLTSTPLAATAIIVAFPAAAVALPLGQPTPFVLFGIVCCAAFLHAGRERCAALAALLTMLDPRVGLVLCAVLLAGVPRARLTVGAGLGILALFDLAAFGAARELEYLREVVPLHALVNVPEFSQYSAANIAYTLGVSPSLARSIGSAWYFCAAVTGVVAGLRLRPRFGAAGAVFIPMAFVVFGGSHTHLQQLALALPAFLLVTSAAAGARRRLLVVLTFAASIPWLFAAPAPLEYAAVAVLGIAFTRLMGAARMSFAVGIGSLTVLLALCAAILGSHGAPYVPFVPSHVGNPLAETSWGLFVTARSVPPQPWYLLAKLPTLTAFSVLLAALLRAAITPRVAVLAP